MNEFQAWQETVEEWKEVKRMTSFLVLLDISLNIQKNMVFLYQKNEIKRMANRIHYLMNEIEPSSDESLQQK